MLGLGLGLQYGGVLFAYDSQAVAHYNRVIADGGTIPAGLAGCDAWFKAVKGVYGVSDITSAISSGIHPHYLGYKAGAGSGATLGSAAQTCYNAIGAIGDVVQTTAASQPLILPHTGTNYVYLPGINGNGFTTPHSLSNNITQDWEVVIQTKFSNSTSIGCLVSKRELGNSQYAIFKLTAGSIYISQTISGVEFNITCASNVGTSFNGFIKITRNATTGTILIYTSLDGFLYNLQSTNAGPIGTLDTINTPVKIGAEAISLITGYSGDIYRLTISNSIGGNPVVDFNPASYSRATSQTTWTSTTGEVWTINTPSTNNALKAAIVDTTYLMGNGTSIGMRAASLNMTQTGLASYTAIRKFVNTVGSQIITELGTSISSSAGKYFGINFTASQEEFGVYANVGLQNSRYSQTSTALKLATQIIDIANANEASPYLINNLSQTFVAQDSVSNNTAAMNGTGYNLLARNNAASLWANVMMACDIVSKNADSTGTQTAMYTALKPFLVNAI